MLTKKNYLLYTALMAVTTSLASGIVPGNEYGYGTGYDSKNVLFFKDLGASGDELSAGGGGGYPYATHCGSCGGGSLGGLIGSAAGPGPALAASSPIIRTQKVDFVQPLHSAIPEPANVFVESHNAPINLMMRSISHGVNLQHQHIAPRGTVKHTETREEPHRHLHTVHKPIIQEIREIFTPYRLVHQEILPVREKVITKVAKSVPVAAAPVAAGPLALAPRFKPVYGHGGELSGSGLGAYAAAASAPIGTAVQALANRKPIEREGEAFGALTVSPISSDGIPLLAASAVAPKVVRCTHRHEGPLAVAPSRRH